MFQNVTEGINDRVCEENRINLILKEMFKKSNIIIYILTFLVSSVSISTEIIPFGLAILAACMGSTVPVFMVFITSMISTIIFHGSMGFTTYIYISIIFFLMNFMFKPKVAIEERNEILLVGGKLFGACFIYYFIKNVRDVFLLYDLFLGTIISALTYVFYKIFVNGITVIRDFKTKNAFSIEEVIGATIIFAIAVSVFDKIEIANLNVSNVFIILMILILGLKNGLLLGGVSGISIGLALMLIGRGDMMLLAVLCVSGALAGFFNNFGKIGVIIGFILGNAILTYLVTGNTIQVVYYREIMLSSLILLFIPSKFRIKLSDIFPKDKLLTNYGEHRLDGYSEIKDKLDNVVDTINKAVKNPELEVLSDKKMKEEFIQDFLDSFEEYSHNIFYEDIKENEELISEVYDSFLVEDILTEKIIIDIFKKHNNYILLRDEKIKNDLQELIKIMNQTFRVIQMNNVKAKYQQEQKQKINSEIKTISKVISKVTDEIDDNLFSKKEKEIMVLLKGKNYPINNVRVKELNNRKIIVTLNLDFKDESIREKSKLVNISDILSKTLGNKVVFQRDVKNNNFKIYNQIYASEDKFSMQVGSSKIAKSENLQSGDSNLQVRLKDGKYVLAISDGMGSGEKARQASKNVIEILNKSLADGFNEDEILDFINTNMNLMQENDMYASLDLNIFDLYTGQLMMLKNGACNTYIKNRKNITVYKSESIPVGTVDKILPNKKTVDLNEDDIIVMCSDGVLESKSEYMGDWVENFLKNINTNNVQKIADLILSESIDNSYGVAADDITVIVAKILKRK